MAALSDILTSAQNIATAINNAAQTYLKVQGTQNVSDMTTPTLVSAVGGRLATVSVTVAGSVPGLIYDTNSVASTLRPIYSIPNMAGLFPVNLPVGYGIVVAPGTGQAVTVSYS